jgi:glycosyltransferase involved in cell wall biosynthesis
MIRGPSRAGEKTKRRTWARLIDGSITAYDRALGRQRAGRSRVHRSRATRQLAVVTPLPPSQTGIAPYSLRLLDAMAADRVIHAYADGRDGVPVQREWRNIHAHAIDEFAGLEGHRTEHAQRLMCFGNSRFHVAAWRLLMEFGGDVLLHEVSLCGLYLTLDSLGLLGAGGVDARVRELDNCSFEAAVAAPCGMVTEVVDAARRVFVHTEQARRLLIERRPDRADDVSVVGFALPRPRPRRQRMRDPVVASFGYMRSPELVIDAFAEIVGACPSARLWLVGAENQPGQLDRLLESVRVRGLTERITFTGWVDEEEYRRRLEATAVAIQPRNRGYGECSSALGDLLAAGVPTVVNDTGAGAVIPAEAVVHVHSDASDGELAAAAIELLRDPARQTRISSAAIGYATAHSAARAAGELLAAIDA